MRTGIHCYCISYCILPGRPQRGPNGANMFSGRSRRLYSASDTHSVCLAGFYAIAYAKSCHPLPGLADHPPVQDDQQIDGEGGRRSDILLSRLHSVRQSALPLRCRPNDLICMVIKDCRSCRRRVIGLENVSEVLQKQR